MDLYVEEYGSGAPLVLLHGLGASGRDWEAQIPVLSPHFRVIVPDLRGFGRSPRQQPYDIARFTADVGALVDGLGLTRFALAGHSMGGAIAQQFVLDRPGRVSRLLLANTAPSFVPRNARERSMLWLRLMLISVLGPAALSRFISGRLFPEAHQRELRQRIALRNAANEPAVYREAIASLVRWNVVQRLGEIEVPTLVVAAQHDYFSTELLHEYSARLPNCAGCPIVPGARHALPLERPREFNALMLDFLRPGEPA